MDNRDCATFMVYREFQSTCDYFGARRLVRPDRRRVHPRHSAGALFLVYLCRGISARQIGTFSGRALAATVACEYLRKVESIRNDEWTLKYLTWITGKVLSELTLPDAGRGATLCTGILFRHDVAGLRGVGVGSWSLPRGMSQPVFSH